MVFARKLESKGKKYWILEHTIREGNRFIKKTRYIGKELPSKEELEKMKKQFLGEIAGSRYKYLSREDFENIETKKKKHQHEVKNLSESEKEKNLKEFMVRFTYNSSKLSGLAITLRQTSLILEEGIVPKDIKSLRTVKELENHKKGILIITKYHGQLNLKFIQKLNKVLFSGIDEAIAGKLRDELKRNVKIAGTTYVPPKWPELKKELDGFFKWYKSEKKRLHPLELAALIHLKMISMQPFADGNSRLSRLLMNWILWKKGYPPVEIPLEDSESYYDVLDKYQIEKDEKSFINYILS